MERTGRQSLHYHPGDQLFAVLATHLAEAADRAGPWPGIMPGEPFPITLLVTRSAARFDSLTRGRLPAWTGAAAFPGSNTGVLRVTGDPFRTLRHELAHLMLARAAPRAPLWFAEGYAVRAAGEWDALDVLALNWQLVRGRPPGFLELERDLRAGPAHARAAYALAATAVLYLERTGGERGLGPLIAALGEHWNERCLVKTNEIPFAVFRRSPFFSQWPFPLWPNRSE